MLQRTDGQDAGAERRALDHGALDEVLACLPHGAIVLDADASIALVNEAALSLVGYERDELVGHGLTALLPAVSDERLSRLLAEATGPHRRSVERALLRKRDGALVSVHLTFSRLAQHAPGLVLASIAEMDMPSAARDMTREVEACVRELVESLPHLIWRSNADGSVYLVNHRWQEFSGLAEDELLGTGWTQVIHPEDMDRAFAVARHAVEAGTEYHVEFRIRRHDGVYRWFDVQAVPVRNERGQIVQWVGAGTEIHESVELRERLRAEQERLASIVESAPGAVVSFVRARDGTSRFAFVSAGARAVYGFSPEEMTADTRRVLERVQPDDLAAGWAMLDRSARERSLLSFDARYRHPERGEIWLETRATPRTGADESVIWSGLVTDVTARKRAEEELNLTRMLLEGALEAADMGAWVWDTERGVWCSEGCRRMFDLPDDAPAWIDLVTFSARILEEDLERVMDVSTAALESGQGYKTEFRVKRRDGTQRWIAARGKVDVGLPGRSRRLAGIDRDITQEKIATETMLRSQKLEALGTLAGGVAHEFNNLLFAIAGNAALALDAIPDAHRAHGFVRDIGTASARATELVRQILAFSRPHERKREVLKLVAPIEEALRFVRSVTPAGIQVKAELDEGVPWALTDPGSVVQVVVNLCANAVHAIGKNHRGTIEVRLETAVVSEATAEPLAPGRYAVLSVRDDGCGIDEALHTRIFDPFFTTKPIGEGTGLGLSVVHGIMRALDGHVGVESRPGQGTLFRLYFPAQAAPNGARSDAPVVARAGAGKRVLFVDDEDLLVNMGRSFLEILEYRPAAFSDPRAALDAFRREPDAFAAVVTDIAMPTMSGFELARSLRALRPDLPIVMMSGFIGPEEQEAASALGVRNLVLKPISIKELGELLDSVC